MISVRSLQRSDGDVFDLILLYFCRGYNDFSQKDATQ